MSDEKPFADVRELRPNAVEPSAVCIGDLIVSWHGCPTIARRVADALNAAVAARERKAAARALRDAARDLVACGREWQAYGHVPTHADYLRQIELRAAAIEGGAT